MKNYEKYAEEIKGYKGENFCDEFIKPHILKSKKCYDTPCDLCHTLQTIWLFEECEESEEPKTDWNKVEVDTPILVRENENEIWKRRYFAKYENGFIYTWSDGRTSWNEVVMIRWKYAKLAEGEQE